MSTPAECPRRSHTFARALIVAGLVVAALPGVASAKGRSQPPSTSAATCSVTPNPVPLGSQYTIAGAGYAPNEILQEWVNGGSGTSVFFGGADANGNLSIAAGWANQTGAYSVTVKDASSGKALASCGFTI